MTDDRDMPLPEWPRSQPYVVTAPGVEPAETPVDSVKPAVKPSVKKRSVAGNAMVLLVSQGATWSMAILLSVLLPRYLGPSGVGSLHLATSIWAIVLVVCSFGAPTMLTLEIARDRRTGGALAGQVIKLQLLLYAVAWLPVMGFAHVASYDRSTVAIIAITGVGALCTMFSGTIRASLYGLEQMQYVAIADVTSRVLLVPLLMGALLLGAGVQFVAAMTAAAAFVAAAIMFHYMLWFPSVRLWRTTVSRAEVLRRGRAFFFLDLTTVAYIQLDVVIISLMLDERSIGFYASATVLTGSLLFIPTIFMTSAFPAIARMQVERPEAVPVMLRRTFVLLVVSGVPIGFGAACLANPAMVLLLGDDFAPAGSVLAVMGYVIAVMFPAMLVGRVALIMDRQRLWATMTVVALVATVPIDLLFIRWADQRYDNGAIGGALSYAVTESALLAFGVWKVVPGLLDRATWYRVAKAMLAGAVMSAAVWPLRDQLILIPLVAGAVTYVAMIALLRVLHPDEVRRIRSVLDRVVPRRPGGRSHGPTAEVH